MLQQATKEKYGIETLKERNVSYDHEHGLTQKDVDMANNHVQLIERTRSEVTPQIGDRLVYVTEHGDYYGNALIDGKSTKEGYLSICEQPYVPFVWEEGGSIRLSVSGGAFHSVNPKDMKFLKWDGRSVQGLGTLRCMRQRFSDVHCQSAFYGSMPNPIPGMEISRQRPTGSFT